MEITDVDYAPDTADKLCSQADLIRMCYECGSGDVRWCSISVRPYCAECDTWGPVNYGSAAESVATWNKRVAEQMTK